MHEGNLMADLPVLVEQLNKNADANADEILLDVLNDVEPGDYSRKPTQQKKVSESFCVWSILTTRLLSTNSTIRSVEVALGGSVGPDVCLRRLRVLHVYLDVLRG